MSWIKYQGKALADTTLTGGALLAELEGQIRLQHPHFTDVRMEQATATERYDTSARPPRQWYEVTYLADDSAGPS